MGGFHLAVLTSNVQDAHDVPSLSIRSAPSVIAILPSDCNAPSEFAVPTACAVPTPTTLLVATPTSSDAQVPAAPTPPPPPP